MTPTLTVAALVLAALADDPGYLKGRELFEGFEYEQALERFQELSANPSLTTGEQAEVRLWVALCLDGVGRTEDADRAMFDALRIDATAAMPTAASPNVVARFERAVAAVRAEAAKRQAPPPPGPVPAPAPGPPPLALVLGAGSGATLLGGAALGVVAAERWARSTDASLFVDERAGAHAVYAWCLGGAVVSGLLAAGLATGAVLALSTSTEPTATGSGG